MLTTKKHILFKCRPHIYTMKKKTKSFENGFSFEVEEGKGIQKGNRKTLIGNYSATYKLILPKEEVEKYNLLEGKVKVTFEKL